MSALLVLLSAVGLSPAPRSVQTPLDSVTVCVVDQATGAPVIGASLRWQSAARGAGESAPPVHRMRATCERVPAGDVTVQRVGYRPLRVQLRRDGDAPQQVALHELVGASLDTVRVRANVNVNADAPARMTGTMTVDVARATGASNTNQLIERLPFVQVRSARGETGLSLRGARREQVAITLDGLPLNDPATGIADVSDIPLIALGSATVALGADPLGAGPASLGGVLALASAPGRAIGVRLGSLGQAGVEGAWSTAVRGAFVQTSVAHRVAANDFLFDNTAGASGDVQRERRVNNDETRTGATVAISGDRAQVSVLASHAERGMVGAANVRTYDNDRAQTDRVLLRARVTAGRTELVAGARQFVLAYRDPTRPVLNADARASAGDVEWRGPLRLPAPHAMSVRWSVGGGGDQLRASGAVRQSRGRAYALIAARGARAGWRVDGGARLDAIGGAGVQPSFTLATDHPLTAWWSIGARAAQALRAPTLYDLYFASPQRLTVTALQPERVPLDAELSTRFMHASAHHEVRFDLALVARDTRDAIVWFPGNFGWSPANVGRERLRGMESRLRVVTAWGDLLVWGTHYESTLTSGPLQIPTPYVPRNAAGSQWMLRLHGVNTTLTTRTTGRRPFTAGPRDPAYELPAVTLLDAAVSHALPRRLQTEQLGTTVTWSIDNLTDAAWQSVRGFPSPGRTFALAITLRHP